MNKIEHRVLYSDTDAGKVVYYANYLKWFESGRRELIRQMGIDLSALDKEGIIIPVIEVKCNYLSPALYDDVIEVETKISEIKDKTIKFEYEIYRKTGKKLLASGYTVNVFVDKEKMKSVSIPDNVRKKLKN